MVKEKLSLHFTFNLTNIIIIITPTNKLNDIDIANYYYYIMIIKGCEKYRKLKQYFNKYFLFIHVYLEIAVVSTRIQSHLSAHLKGGRAAVLPLCPNQ